MAEGLCPQRPTDTADVRWKRKVEIQYLVPHTSRLTCVTGGQNERGAVEKGGSLPHSFLLISNLIIEFF